LACNILDLKGHGVSPRIFHTRSFFSTLLLFFVLGAPIPRGANPPGGVKVRSERFASLTSSDPKGVQAPAPERTLMVPGGGALPQRNHIRPGAPPLCRFPSPSLSQQKERTSGGRFVVLAFFFNERDFIWEIVMTGFVSNEFFSPAWVPIF
jgi:hypothetical protein